MLLLEYRKYRAFPEGIPHPKIVKRKSAKNPANEQNWLGSEGAGGLVCAVVRQDVETADITAWLGRLYSTVQIFLPQPTKQAPCGAFFVGFGALWIFTSFSRSRAAAETNWRSQ